MLRKGMLAFWHVAATVFVAVCAFEAAKGRWQISGWAATWATLCEVKASQWYKGL
jgi:hypothetical protein